MTGPEHYREAELLLAESCEYGCPHSGCEHERGHLARAQVHATLFAGAAAALPALDVGPALRATWIRTLLTRSESTREERA
jgi:hypothetical protein